FFASLLAPLLLRSYGPSVAFGVPGVLMFIATVVFWLGRRQYVNVPPSGRDPDSFLNVVRTTLRAHGGDRGGFGTRVARTGVAIAVLMLVLWALSAVGVPLPWPESFGFVITACLALGVVIACVGWGASLQLERARGLHPEAAVDG